jgi:hypothetical protein
MDLCTLVTTIVGVGEHYNTSTEDLKRLVAKLCVLSLRYVSRRDLWEELFGGDDYVHWELLEKSPPNVNVVGDLSCWLSLMSVCSWPGLQQHEGEIVTRYTSLATIRRNMKEAGIDAGAGDGYTLACQALLLTLVRGLPGLHSLEMLTCQFFKRDTHAACMALLARQADTSFSPEEQLETLAFVLGHMQVNTNSLQQNLAIVRARREERELCLKLKSAVSIQGRPRLRSRLSSTFNTQDSKMQADIALNTWESYAGWCYIHTLPTTLSEGIKHRLYFLSSQTSWKWVDYLPRVLPSAKTILGKIAQFPVTNPDLPIVVKVISQLRMDGAAPFPELTDFKVKCFAALPVSHVQRMTLSEILQAYVAIYQAPAIWKEVFRSVVGVLSVSLIRACETFVRDNPFNAEAFIPLLIKS